MLQPWLRKFTTKDTKSTKEEKERKLLPHAETRRIQEERSSNKTQWSNAILGDSFPHMTPNREYRKRFST